MRKSHKQFLQPAFQIICYSSCHALKEHVKIFFTTMKLLKKLNYILKPVTPGVRALNIAVKDIQTFSLTCMQSSWLTLWEKENCVFWQVAREEISRFWARLFLSYHNNVNLTNFFFFSCFLKSPMLQELSLRFCITNWVFILPEKL